MFIFNFVQSGAGEIKERNGRGEEIQEETGDLFEAVTKKRGGGQSGICRNLNSDLTRSDQPIVNCYRVIQSSVSRCSSCN